MRYQIAAAVLCVALLSAVLFLSPCPWLAPLPSAVAAGLFAWLYDDGEEI